MKAESAYLGLDVVGHHAPLLQFEFAGFLSKGARGTAPTAAKVAASVALDTITLTDTFTTAHLDNATQSTADGKGTMSEAITTA